MEGAFGEDGDVFGWVEGFDGAAEGEVGAEVVVFGDAFHGEGMFADDEDAQVVSVGNELLENEGFVGLAVVVLLGDDLFELGFRISFVDAGAFAGAGEFEDDGVGDLVGVAGVVVDVSGVDGVGKWEVVVGEFEEVGDFVDGVLVFDKVVVEDFDVFVAEVFGEGVKAFDVVEDGAEDGDVGL